MEGVAVELGVGAVKFMVEGLIQQLKEQNRLVSEAPHHVRDLESDLNFLKDYLKEAVKNPNRDNLNTRTLLREVHDCVYRAEDAIDSFLIQVADSESKWFSRATSKPKISELAKIIISIAEKVKQIREKVEQRSDTTGLTTDNLDQGCREYEGPRPNQRFAPIHKEDEKILREYLTQETQKSKAILITGMHGTGKTTLAAKMYFDPIIRERFTKHIWVSVSNPTERNILLVILRQLNEEPPSSKKDWELSQQVARCLEGETFLIVVDNLAEIKDWELLESAFERSDTKSKILITSTNDKLARFLGHDSHIKLGTLGFEESWSLLQWQVFSGPWCPPELENYGKLIARNCNGLTQAIAFAGKTLARNDSPLDEMSRRKKVWQDFSHGMITYFDDREGAENRSIETSYNNLPYSLRACFLYLGIFPEKSKFSVSKLIRMWIAEGFIPPNGDVALEKTAEDYLNYLIDRSLVIIEEKGPDGSAKSCSMNPLLYNFCKTEAGNKKENLFTEFRKCSSDGAFFPAIKEVEKNRRVCIHAHISKFIPKFISSRIPTFQNSLRSFISHSEEEFTLENGDISNIRAAFKLLRVLDAKPMKFNKIHSDLCELAHLRFVTLSLNGDVLPAGISKLRNIQTLIVHTASPTLEVKTDILNMAELRHFKTNASATLPKKSKASAEDECLQTLCGISHKSCTMEFFEKTPNLKKLGIHGKLARLLDEKDELLSQLVNVKKLKLLNNVTSPKPSSLLLQQSRLPPSLRSLTLSATYLDWKHISFLRSLQQLEELKLKDNAFEGEKWEVSDKNFPNLQILHIERSDFKWWKSSSSHFPKLRRLTLSKCKELMEIPVELAEIRTFRELLLRNCNESAAESAQKIRAEKLKMKRNDNSIVFKLSFDDL